MARKKEGFKNQKAIILPEYVREEINSNPITKLLYITDVGYYPDALYHYRERPNGSDQHILIYCTHGSGWVEAGNTSRKIQKDDFLIIPALLPHRYGANNLAPWTIYWLHFKGEISSLLAGNDLVITNINSDINTRNDRRIRLFDELYQNLSMGYSKENLEYASICLWYLLGSFNYPTQFERIRTIQQNEVVEKSIVYMHNHIDDELTLDQLATLCGLSVSHYSLVFKKKTSRSPIEYFIDLKMQKACQLLDFTDMHIKEIASQLNFNDPFYFSRVFRRVIGISPAEYRKKKKG